MTTAYLYQYTQKSTGKWYIGCRTAKNCHPEENYLTSSKIVKPQIKAHPSDWKKQILCIGDPEYIRNLETQYLTMLDAKNNIYSYNQHNNSLDFFSRPGHKIMSEAEKQKARQRMLGKTYEELYGTKRSSEIKNKIRDKLKGRIRPPFSELHKQRLSEARSGRTLTDEHKKAISIANQRPTPDDVKKKISATLKKIKPRRPVMDPNGNIFECANTAAKANNVTPQCIRWRIKNNKGWRYHG